MLEQKSPNVYARHWLTAVPVIRGATEQEPQQFPVVLHERVAGHDPDAGNGMKLAEHCDDGGDGDGGGGDAAQVGAPVVGHELHAGKSPVIVIPGG